MEALLTHSWRRAWQALHVTGAGLDALRDELLAAWSQPQRCYHGLQHLAECLALLEPALPLAGHPGEVEIALWFHDAVYDPRAQDNEARSAAWAHRALRTAGVAQDVAERVAALVLATCHDAAPTTPDAQLLVDVDLAILGAAPERFDEYERQVRAEYGWVPQERFDAARRALLQRLLARPRLYGTAPFRARFEAPARANLARALARLG